MTHKIASQIDLVNAILRHLDSKCGVTELRVRDLNVIARCATEIVDELAKPDIPVVEGMGLVAWFASDGTGLSSRYIAGVLGGSAQPFAFPRDPADFGRCLGLLDAVPEFRERLIEMAVKGDEWAALVEAWDELEALYKEESPSGYAPKCYQRMKDLLNPVEP